MEQQYFQGKYRIIERRNLARDCYDFVIHCPDIAMIAQPGQFVHVKADGFVLRRPISICEINHYNETIRIVFEVRGEGTAAIAKLDSTVDIIAPLGRGFTMLHRKKRAIAVGGGIGAPPMLGVAQQYDNPVSIVGFRSASVAILEDDFAKAGKTILCTDDGSVGHKGFVTTALEQEITIKKPDIIYACGPHPMLRGVVEIARANGIQCEVSLEERMGCGVGACLVCACKTVKNGEEYYAHVCKDGPVFDSEEVVL